jgi:asparagine synthase (glutamine-hydrolysing)
MGYFCAIIEKSASKGVDSNDLHRMLNAAGAGRMPDGLTPCPPWVGFHGPMAAGFVDMAGGWSGRGFYEDDRMVIVCDGEFYNADALCDSIGLQRGQGEASIMAAYYRKFGEGWHESVRGIFGAFLWDKHSSTAFAWTDRIGVRPVVWYEDGQRIAVSTRIDACAALPGFQSAMDNQGLFSYLFMEMIPTPYTLYRSVRKLESGFRLRIKDGQLESKRYWNMRYPTPKLTDQAEMEQSIRNLVRSAVHAQARSGVASPDKAGAFLSGGTDSSVVAGLMSELDPGKSKTFSIGFDEPGYDEMEFARIAVRRFQTDSDEYYVTQEDVVNALPRIVAAFDEPFANSSVIPTYFCAMRGRSKGVEVMLGGDGGDEIFGGNARYSDYYQDFSRFPKPVEWAMAMAVAVTPQSLQLGPLRKVANYLSRKNAPLHKRIHAYDLSYYLGSASGIFSPEFMRAGPYLMPHQIAERIVANAETQDELDKFLYHDLKNTLMDNDLRKVNTVTELAGIRVRYPLLDQDVVEYTGRIPTGLKVKDKALRYLYKQAFKDFLPQEIIHKTKHGFGIPVVRWMMRPGRLNEMLKDALFDGKLAQRGLFKKGFVESLYKRAEQDKSTYFGSYLYYTFFLELWLREHQDKSGSHNAPSRIAASSAVSG